MKQFSRRMWWLPAIAAGSLKGQDVPVVATAEAGEPVFEFIGTIGQNGGSFIATGYLTAVAGLPEKLLFTDPVTRSQQSARFGQYLPTRPTNGPPLRVQPQAGIRPEP